MQEPDDDPVAVAHPMDPDASALVLAEFNHLATSFLANEDMGERRVNVLLGMVGAVAAGLGLAEDRFPDDDAFAAAVALAGVALLAFGLLTLRRLAERNLVTTSYLNGLRRIRSHYVRRDPRLTVVLPFPPPPEPIVRQEPKLFGIGKAGYVQTAAFANCLLIGVALGAAAWTVAPPVAAVAIALAGALAGWPAQMVAVRRRYRAARRDGEVTPEPDAAGGGDAGGDAGDREPTRAAAGGGARERRGPARR